MTTPLQPQPAVRVAVDLPARGPVRAAERALAPDLARGLMLLLIVTSNTMFFLWGANYRTPQDQHPIPTSAVDAVAQVAMTVVLDMRIYPLFAFLFGYGMVQLFRRQVAAGSSESAAVRLLRRRGAWLLLFGFVHAALLLATDVLSAYGVISLVLSALFFRRADRTLRAWSVAGAVLLLGQLVVGVLVLFALQAGVIPADVAASGGSDTVAQLSNPEASGAASANYLASVVSRLTMWTGITGITVFGITAPLAMLLGIQAARRRILEEPGQHRRLLVRTAAVGLAIGWLGGLPAALAHLGVWTFGEAGLRELALLSVQWPTGLAGGVGYVALLALLAHRLGIGPHGRLLTGVTSVGRRSLSCYLTHSLLLGPVLAAWGLGLGAYLTSATAMAYAAAVWLITLAGAAWLDHAGRRGPAETLLRRLMYGPRT